MARQVAIFKNMALTDVHTADRTSTVGEPSLANNGRHVLYTGNWYAARSADSGATWEAIDPFTFFPSADGGFCCDQTVHYDQGRDLTIWLLQYIELNGTNTLRIAVKEGHLDTAANWRFWDLKPAQIDSAWAGEWFDYNHAALSNNFLYVGTNVFRASNDQWTRSVIFRISLESLTGTGSLDLDRFVSTDNFSLRCAQGATDVMYFVSHNSTAQFRFFEWPENSANVTSTDINITAWDPGDMSAPGPGTTANWLSRCDYRITGVWSANGIVGVMWTANRQAPQRPFPFIRVVRISAATKTVIDEPDIWSAETAYAYPEAAANIQGLAGVTLFMGGGNQHPTHAVGFRDDLDNSWKLQSAVASTHSPSDSKWGDYLGIRRHSPDGLGWIASGFALEGGGARTDIVPRYIHFGLEEHRAAAGRWLGV
jgi:hypothetical protein